MKLYKIGITTKHNKPSAIILISYLPYRLNNNQYLAVDDHNALIKVMMLHS